MRRLLLKYKYEIINYTSLKKGNLRLKPIEQNQIFTIMDWRNHQIDFLRQKSVLSKNSQLLYFKNVILKQIHSLLPTDIIFSVFELDVFIAYGGLTNIDWPNKTAEISYLSYPNSEDDFEIYCSRFTSFISIISNLAFENLRLKQLFTITYPQRISQIVCLDNSMLRSSSILYKNVNDKYENTVIHYLNNQNK